MNSYKITMVSKDGHTFAQTYQAQTEKLARSFCIRKKDMAEIISVEIVDKPMDPKAAMRRYWAVLVRDFDGRRQSLLFTALRENDVRRKCEVHAKCDVILQIQEVCESQYKTIKEQLKNLG